MTVNSQCRACASANLHKVIDLGLQPLANAFLHANQLGQIEETFPLEVYFCADCNLVQLIHIVDKQTLFSDYIYFSSGMPRLADHFERYADDVMRRFLGAPTDLVVEIGSNDGILLQFFKAKQKRVLGVDPAQNIAAVAVERGIPTIADFFSEEIAGRIVEKDGQAMAILGNNVVAHINDYADLCRGVDRLLAPRGVFIFEAPYLVDMFERLTFDTIYHEHLSYLAIRPMQQMLKQYGLEIFDVQIVPAQGKSIRVFVGRVGAYPIERSVSECVRAEIALGLNTREAYDRLAKQIAACKEKTLAFVAACRESGKRVAAYGAPAKGNTVLNYYGLRAPLLEFALDDLPGKQGLYTPGTHIPVVSREYAEAHAPDCYFLLAWNYWHVIRDKEKNFLDAGGQFLLPTGDIADIAFVRN